MFRRAGVARAIICLLLLVLAACSRSDSTASPKTTPSPKAAKSSPSEDKIVREINDQIIEPLQKAFETSDRKALPPITDGISDKNRERILLAADRTSDFGVNRVRLKMDSKKLSRSEHSRSLTGSYRLKDVSVDLPFSASIRVEPVGEDGWQLKYLEWNLEPAWAVEKAVTRTKTAAAIIFHPAGFDAAELGTLVGQARSNLGKSLSDVRSKTYLVLVPADSSDFDRVGGGGAATVTSVHETKGREFTVSEPWLLVKLSDWEDADPPTRRSLILHEVTHAILAPVTSALVPDWVGEGVAVYFSGDPGLEVIRREPEELQERSLMKMAAGQWRGLSVSDYAISGAAISHLVERFGEKAVLDFLESCDEEQTDEELEKLSWAMIRHETAREQGEAIAARLLEKRFDMTLEQLDAAAKDWIRARI
jgi:hypothetical protein